MSMNYTQLSTAIQDYTQNTESSFVTHIPDFVREAEQVIYTTVQLPIFRKNQTGALAASNRYLAVPTDYISPYSLLVSATGSVQTPLLFKDVEWLREAYPDPTVTGTPRYYAQYDSNTFLIAPTPTGSYPVEIHYYYFPQSIVDGSTSWLGTNYEQVLLWGSLVNAYTYMKGEKDLLQFYDAQFKQALAGLKKVADGMDRQDTFRTPQMRQAVT